jgi:hypothetical protein
VGTNLSDSWQHSYTTTTGQVSHANEQFAYSLLSDIALELFEKPK